ncbi:MAG: helix-turn-helix domain-containing protein [Eubacteriales bacterium]
MRNQSLYFQKLFKTLAIVFSIILILCSILLTSILYYLYHQSLASGKYNTIFLKEHIDSELLAIQKISSLITLDSLSKTCLDPSIAVQDKTSAMYELSDTLYTYKILNENITSIQLYHGIQDYIIGDLGLYQKNMYDQLSDVRNQTIYDNNLSTQLPTGFHIIKNNPTVFCFIQELISNKQPVGFLIIEINIENLLENIDQLGTEHESTFLIALGGQLLSNTLSSNIEPSYVTTMLQSDDHSFFTLSKHILFSEDSDLFPITYLHLYERSQILSTVFLALCTCIIGLLLLFGFSFLSSYYISKSNDKPLQLLIEKLGENSKDNLDEYALIHHKIDYLLDQNQESIDSLLHKQDAIDTLFFNLLISSEMNSEFSLMMTANKYHIQFNYTYFVVIVIQPLISLSYSFGVDDETKIKSLFLQNNPNYECMTTNQEHSLILLCNMDEETSRKSLCNILHTILTNEYSETSFKIGCGKRVDSFITIIKSYHQALLAISFKQATTPFICYNDLLDQPPISHKNFMEQMDAFTLAILQQKYDIADDLLPKLFKQFPSSHENIQIYELRIAHMKCLLCDSIEHYHATSSKKSLPSHLTISALLLISHVEELRRFAIELLTTIRQNEYTQDEVTIPEATKQLIADNFTNPMFGLYSISEVLNVSNSYISTIFKKTYDMGVIQYINYLRIEHAKELILTTDLSLKEIAAATGFTSDITFIRVFKKYENMTPKMFKKSKLL